MISEVTKLNFSIGPTLVEEMEFFSKTDEGKKTYEKFSAPADVIRFVEDSNEYRDMKQLLDKIPGKRVLDVGVAYGITSAYLAANGFDVVAIEPSLPLCEDMAEFFQRMGLSVHVANGTGESMDQLGGGFDAVVFNSSFHHCDDVPRTLANARKNLRAGGVVCLVNEPVLKFYRTKDWFYRTLKEHPEQLGHYGGNEHIYRYGEYVGFLEKAGFSNVASFPSLNYAHLAKRAPWDSPARYAIKRAYHFIVKNVALRSALLVRMLNRLSLLNCVIIGR